MVFVCIEQQTFCYRFHNIIRIMKKIYFYESNPEPKVWERMIENVDGVVVLQTPWKICENLNGNCQEITSESKQIEILEAA